MLVAATLLVTLSSCATTEQCGFHAFAEKEQWANYSQVALDKRNIFQWDERQRPSRFKAFANRVDYLEAYGSSVNAAMGEDE